MAAAFDKTNPVVNLAAELDAPDREQWSPLGPAREVDRRASWGSNPDALAGLAAATGASS